MRRDVPAGAALIIGALASVFALALHPTGHDLLTASGGGPALLTVVVHAVAIGGQPLVLLGLLGLARGLDWSAWSVGALMWWAFGVVAVLSAAVASGLIAPDLIERLRAAGPDGRAAYQAVLQLDLLMNRGYAQVFVVASSVGLLLWAVAFVKDGRVPRAPGVAGGVLGTVTLLALFGRHLTLDVHGFGMVAFSQGAWMIWVGVLLILPRRTRA